MSIWILPRGAPASEFQTKTDFFPAGVLSPRLGLFLVFPGFGEFHLFLKPGVASPSSSSQQLVADTEGFRDPAASPRLSFLGASYREGGLEGE